MLGITNGLWTPIYFFQGFDEFFPQFFFSQIQKFVYFQRFDEFFHYFQSLLSIQKFDHFQRIDEFFHYFRFLLHKTKNAFVFHNLAKLIQK